MPVSNLIVLCSCVSVMVGVDLMLATPSECSNVLDLAV